MQNPINILYFKCFRCYSNLGNVGGPQVISLSEPCFKEGFITHEMQHSLGFPHEHNRIDRDDYIGLKPENIPQGKITVICVNFRQKKIWNRFVPPVFMSWSNVFTLFFTIFSEF